MCGGSVEVLTAPGIAILGDETGIDGAVAVLMAGIEEPARYDEVGVGAVAVGGAGAGAAGGGGCVSDGSR